MDISSMLEVQVKEVKVEADVKENGEHSGSRNNVTSRNQAPNTIIQPIPVSQDEQNYYQITFGNDMASVRYRRLHCTACDTHIGSAPSQVHNMLEHPVLRTLLCSKCRDFYGDGTFEQGDDATDMFCRWCANGGNLYCCSYCSNTFCYKCIKRNFVPRIRKKIEADEKWQCFVCNPTDLYDMRAVCWALLRHIQTVTSILQNEKNMSKEEIDEKMNLDESKCCPRRNKRRPKRKHGSNSEEEDETYVPKINGMPIIIKRSPYIKKTKTRYSTPNGTKQQVRTIYTTTPTPIKPRPSSLPSERSSESKTLFPQNEPTKIECQETVIEPHLENTTVIPTPSTVKIIDSSIPTRYESSAIPPSLYHTAIINQTAASTTYIRPSLMDPMFHHIILPPPPQTSQLHSNSYKSAHPLRNSPNAMVSISKPIENRQRPQLIFTKGKRSDVTLTPNIIDLDSDSDDDEPKIVNQNRMIVDNPGSVVDLVDISSDKIIPVALFSTENDNNIKENQPLVEIYTTLKKPPPTFSDVMLTHSRELDAFLVNVKENMQNFLASSDNETVKDILAASRKIKLFHKNMRSAVFQLAHINDRIIREYNKWERSTKTETEKSSTNQSTVSPRENIDIPLNMICVNESDTESDYEKSDYQIMEPSNHIQSSNILEDLLPFRKSVKHCGVGDGILLTENKATQVYDVVSRDYEKCIGYSVLTKAHYDEKINESVLEPVKVPNENFDKYQEQFIFYLQHIEDYGIETEDMKGLEDSSETFEKSITQDSLLARKLCQNIDLFTTSVEESENRDQEKSSESCVNSVENAMDCTKIVQINKDTDSDSKIQITDVRSTEETEETEPLKVKNSATTLNSDDMSSSKNVGDAVNTEVDVTELLCEEECTIIDD